MKDRPLVFKKEKKEPNPMLSRPPWHILIVDDDQDVHDVTEFALRDAIILDRPLKFHHAYSGAESVEYLKNNPQIATVLMDAVMETDDAGLNAVKYIREVLKMDAVRIILRTGQPGQVPELETITRFDINDYKTKSELTKTKLITTLFSALRSWEQINRLDNSRMGLEKIIEASNELIVQEGLETFAEGVVTQIASLFGLDSDGILCTSYKRSDDQENDPVCFNSNCRVIAAAGSYRHLIHHNISDIEDAHIRDCIKQSLKNKQNLIDRESLTVYFEEPSGMQYSTWIDSPKTLNEEDNRLLEIFCTNLSLSASNIELVSRLKRQAWVDPTLDIPNMLALLDKISTLLREKENEGRCLLILDIDGFHQINDLLGHDYGDQILLSLKDRLLQIIGDNAYLARIGADIFGIIMEKSSLTQDLQETLSSVTISTQDGERELSLTIGIVDILTESPSGSDVLRNGYLALKRAKADGFGKIVTYNQKIGFETRERILLLHNLRGAFSEKKLFLMFQPQANLATGKVYSFEALLRWKNPDGQFIPPDRFIPLAEQSGLIIPIGFWVLRMALNSLKKIHQNGYPDLKMAVNVSAMQLRHQNFLQNLDAALSEIEIDPSFLEIEITESIAIMGEDEILKLLGAIRERGVSLAIDDFGTGYSSLSSIDQWPVNRLKIDKSFISNIEDGKEDVRLVDLIIPLGQNLSLQVLAEGVETEWQMKKLKDLGCHEVQGYFLGKPMELEDLLQWLKNRTENL